MDRERYSSFVSSSPFHEGEKFARREDEEIRNWVVGYIYNIYMGERYEKWYLVTKNDCATRQRTGEF